MNGSHQARRTPDAFAQRKDEDIQNAKQAELDRQAKRRRLERVRAAMDAKPRMGEAERKRVARNLWDLLEHFEKGPAGVKKSQVMQRALGTKPEDSTKRLPRYALRPIEEAQLDQPELREKLTAKLRKQLAARIGHYEKLACTGAELAGEDPDEALLLLLSGTKYLDDKAPSHKRDHRAWEVADVLAEQLHALADNLNHDSKIVDYFNFTEQQKLLPHPNDNQLLVPYARASIQPQSLPFESPKSFLMKPNDPISLTRLPRIYIGSTHDSDSWLGMASGFITEDNGAGRVGSFSFPARCIPTWDIYIAIGPLGSARRIIPILALVARTRVRPAADYAFDGFCDDPFEDDPRNPLLFGWMTIGEFDGHARHTEIALRCDQIESRYGQIHFEDFALSMPRADSEAALAEIEAAATLLNRELAEKAPTSTAESDTSWPVDVDPPDADHVQADARASSDEASTEDVAEAPAPPLFASAERGADHPTTDRWYSDLLPADWSGFAGLHIDLRYISADELVDVLTRPIYLRHDTTPAIPADLWTNEQHGATAFDDHPLRDPATREVPSKPVLAPEGTLLALLERWWRGEVRNRKPLRDEIEETVREAVRRLDGYMKYARESLQRSVAAEAPENTAAAENNGDTS